MDEEKFARELEAMLEQIDNAETEELSELAEIAGLDLNQDFVEVDLSGEDLSSENLAGAKLIRANLAGAILYGANLTSADLNGADLTSADLNGAKFGNNPGVGQELQREFEARGAKFVDSPEDPTSIKVLVPR